MEAYCFCHGPSCFTPKCHFYVTNWTYGTSIVHFERAVCLHSHEAKGNNKFMLKWWALSCLVSHSCDCKFFTCSTEFWKRFQLSAKQMTICASVVPLRAFYKQIRVRKKNLIRTHKIRRTLKQWSRAYVPRLKCSAARSSTVHTHMTHHIYSIPRKIKYTKLVTWIDLDKSGTRSCILRTELFTTHFFHHSLCSILAVWRWTRARTRSFAHKATMQYFIRIFFSSFNSFAATCVLRSLHILHWINSR